MRQRRIWPVDSTQDISITGEKEPWCDCYSVRETLVRFILDQGRAGIGVPKCLEAGIFIYLFIYYLFYQTLAAFSCKFIVYRRRKISSPVSFHNFCLKARKGLLLQHIWNKTWKQHLNSNVEVQRDHGVEHARCISRKNSKHYTL